LYSQKRGWPTPAEQLKTNRCYICNKKVIGPGSRRGLRGLKQGARDSYWQFRWGTHNLSR
jgi:hypothetical protein